MKQTKRIGIFDSGAGGLTVAKSIVEHRFFDEIIYFGDTARVPYGTKDPTTITRYALEALEFFKNFDIDLLITACNSVSAYALQELRANADFPIYGVIDPGVRALERRNLAKSAHILILGTRATIASGRYQRGIERLGFQSFDAIAPSLLVPIVEEGLFDGPVLSSTLHHYFHRLQPPDAVILGCTHFPLIADAIGEYFPSRPLLIHSGEAIAEALEREGYERHRVTVSQLRIFASENPQGLKRIASRWLKGDA